VAKAYCATASRNTVAAWEHYPYNGFFFFEDLYGLLEKHPRIRSTTYAEVLSRPAAKRPATTPLPGLTAGSWVYGTLSTWIGDEEKNRAWDLLCAAKQSYDMVLGSERLTAEESAMAERQLAICESSDWFWWFGDYNPSQAVASFDQLYRRNLANLYHLLKLPPPSQLDLPISKGSATAATDGTMRRGALEQQS
jgi:alpha-amylase/alpha-mannosidase (GH57 family)